jgi:phenylacetate-CoA ligase
MDPLKAISRHVLFPVHCWYERNGIPGHLKELERSQWASRGEIEQIQIERLRRLLDHAGRTSPYWQGVFERSDLIPGQVQSLEDLETLPTLSKRDLQTHRLAMRAQVPGQRLIADKTGGSTGEPVHFDLDERRFFYRKAIAYRHDRWAGWEQGLKSAYLWGHPADVAAREGWRARVRKRFMDRHITLDTSSLSADSMTAFRRQLLDYRPEVYVGYANAVYLFARFLEQFDGPYHRPRGIITSAEYLDPVQRQLIERVFQCPVFDRYGSRETGLIASQCGVSDVLHVADESVLVEILTADGRPAGPGEAGRVVVTDLMNYGMPLIRYEIRDTARFMPDRCPCGRGLSAIEMTGGRITDFLLAPDGRIVSGASLTIYLIANAVGVAQAQLVQEDERAITVRLVPGPGYGPETEAWILGELSRFFGKDMDFSVETTSEIPLATSGKHRFSICKIDPTSRF